MKKYKHRSSKGEFIISADKKMLDIRKVHNFIGEQSYWGKGVTTLKDMKKCIKNTAICLGVYQVKKNGKMRQVGFARIITDEVKFAYIDDVFIDPEFRGKGLGKWLVEVIMSIKKLKKIRRWLLMTKDAQDLYRKYGFCEIATPGNCMEIKRTVS